MTTTTTRPTPARTATEIMDAARPLVLAKLESYLNDFEVHDREWIAANDRTPFLLAVRSTGTYLKPLFPSDSDRWPRPGVSTKYLFGLADRWHILRDQYEAITSANWDDPVWIHYDGHAVRPITYEQACDVAREHRDRVEADWRKTGSRPLR